MKRLFFILLLICGFATTANAQFYNEILLFIEVGKTVEDTSSIIYMHFDDDGNMYKSSMNKSTARDKYKKGVLEEYGIDQKHNIERDRSVSTGKYDGVYSKPRYVSGGWGVTGYFMGYPQYGNTTVRSGNEYYAVSDDEMVTWSTTNNSNEAKNKKYYKAIDPSDLVPKEVDYDFL